jgi:hypothetical protein
MIAIVKAKKDSGLFNVDPAVRITSLHMTKALGEFSEYRIKRLDEHHLIAHKSDEEMFLFLTDKSPWYSFIDTNPFWSSSQIKTFNNLCEMLLNCEEYDPFTYEL